MNPEPPIMIPDFLAVEWGKPTTESIMAEVSKLGAGDWRYDINRCAWVYEEAP